MLTKILAVLLMGFLFSSFDFDYNVAARNEQATHTIRHVVKEGETLWSIGERYYDGTRPFDEWMGELRANNGFAVGSGRKYLYPGEVVVIKTTKGDAK
jgi:nucleoid-associated protein YgaU